MSVLFFIAMGFSVGGVSPAQAVCRNTAAPFSQS
jgi:hypothetical protein